ncbi:MAG TPA: 16S rRNA (cytosine(967)-C(5))-methyltransferase RsmB [Candidatus Eisenbacteria bacterium]|nr:16S rRNA (cytosine(967)-C(5))-methyltransferase RsmB [Candidatus Eisenbacteria bacterium]
MPVSPARAAAFDILLRVEQRDAFASELLHSERLDKLTVPDRALTTELVMGVLRWRSRLDQSIAENCSRPLAKLDPEVLLALRIAAYQLLFLSRIPARAAIHESVDLVKRARKSSAAPFANAVLRKLAHMEPLPPRDNAALSAAQLAADFAHPAWLVERWVSQYGIEAASAICRHDQRVPATSIRIENDDVAHELKAVGVTLAPGALLNAARVVTGGDVTQTRAYRESRVFIQDEASQLVALLVGRGSRLLDCCAAPGGKTAVLAARNPTAEIVAAEIHPHRAELLRRRIRAENVRVIAADARHLPLRGEFDRVLADVPCSGTGTLARNPEIKWRLKPEDMPALHAKQVAILEAALQQLAPGGRAVYSTCSLEPEENEAVVAEVLRADMPFALFDCRSELETLRAAGHLRLNDVGELLSGPYLRTLPAIHPCDGFFAAILERQT